MNGHFMGFRQLAQELELLITPIDHFANPNFC